MSGPVFGSGPTSARCGYAAQASVRGRLTVEVGPFPDGSGAGPTLKRAKSQLLGVYRLGTAKDKADERFIDRPDFGAGSFIEADLVRGLPGGTVEDVTVYTPRWTFLISTPTSRLLAGRELSWAKELVASVARTR